MRLSPTVIAVSVAIHLYVVYTLVEQPLDVNQLFLQPAPAVRLAPGHAAIWPLHNDTIHRIGPAADFFAVYHAGQTLRHGLSPYRPVEDPRVTPYFYPFRYLPVVGLTLGRFFTQLEPRAAYWLWIAMLEALLAWLILSFARRFADGRLRCFSVCILLLSSPYALELHMGQFTFAALSLLTIGILVQESPGAPGATRSGGIIGAACYTGAAVLKVFPLVAAPALVRHRRYWPSLVIAASAIVVSSAGYFAAHPADLDMFDRSNWSFTRAAGNMHSGNYGFVYFLYLLATNAHTAVPGTHWDGFTTVWRLLVLAVTAVTVLFTRDQRVGIGVGAMIFAHFLSYRDVWEHHMSGALAVGLLVLWTITQEGPHPRQRIIPILPILTVICLIGLALPTPFVFFDHAKNPAVAEPASDWPASARYVLVLSKVAPTVVLYANCMFLLCTAGFALPRPTKDWVSTP